MVVLQTAGWAEDRAVFWCGTRGGQSSAAVPAGDANLVLPREVLVQRVLRPGLIRHKGRISRQDALGLPLAVQRRAA